MSRDCRLNLSQVRVSPMPLAIAAGLAFGVLTGVACAQSSQPASTTTSESATAPVAEEKARIALIEIEEAPTEKPSDLSWLFADAEVPTLLDYVGAIQEAGEDDGITAIVIRLKDASLTASQVEEISAAIQTARKGGKKVHLFADTYGNTEFMLGAACDEVIAQDGGAVSFPGIYMEEMFLADTLKWAGLEASYVQVGDYKGASEQMARNSPSPQWSQNIDQLLDSMYANLRKPILSGRGLDNAKLDGAMEKLWLADSADAKEAGLVNSVIDLPALGSHLKAQYGKPIRWERPMAQEEQSLDMSNPFAMLSKLSSQPKYTPEGDTIAVVHIDGTIVDGESGGGGLMGGGSSVGSRTIRNTFETLIGEKDIKGVVLRIDSPGGSATASEIMWQGVQRYKKETGKPVWVSVGGMAASGGYYLAVSGDKVYVNPSSIVGSIGVVGGKVSLDGLYDKFKVNVVGRGRGPRAEMFASAKAWGKKESAEVRSKMTDTYNLFTKRVVAGRSGIDLATTAEGRLFTGDKAIGNKMADAIGGLEVCITDMADQLQLEDFEVMHYPEPRPIGEVVKDMLGGFGVQAPLGHASANTMSPARAQLNAFASEVLGVKAWGQVAPSFNAMLQLRDEPVVLVSPTVLIQKR